MPFFGEKKRISRLVYERLNSRFWLLRRTASSGHIASYLASIIAGGELRALDDKSRGKSPDIREIRSNPEPIGHWTSQLCAWKLLAFLHTLGCIRSISVQLSVRNSLFVMCSSAPQPCCSQICILC